MIVNNVPNINNVDSHNTRTEDRLNFIPQYHKTKIKIGAERSMKLSLSSNNLTNW